MNLEGRRQNVRFIELVHNAHAMLRHIKRIHSAPSIQSGLESPDTGFAVYRQWFHGILPDGVGSDWKLLELLEFCEMWNGVEIDTPGNTVMISDSFLAMK